MGSRGSFSHGSPSKVAYSAVDQSRMRKRSDFLYSLPASHKQHQWKSQQEGDKNGEASRKVIIANAPIPFCLPMVIQFLCLGKEMSMKGLSNGSQVV